MLSLSEKRTLAARYGLTVADVERAERGLEARPQPLTETQMRTVLECARRLNLSWEAALAYSKWGLPERYALHGPAGNAGSADYPRPDPAAASAQAGYEATQRPGPMKRRLSLAEMQRALQVLQERKNRGQACSWESVMDELFGDQGNTVKERAKAEMELPRIR
jgi:hypothetical protein